MTETEECCVFESARGNSDCLCMCCVAMALYLLCYTKCKSCWGHENPATTR